MVHVYKHFRVLKIEHEGRATFLTDHPLDFNKFSLSRRYKRGTANSDFSG
jgi:hypothetical protein